MVITTRPIVLWRHKSRWTGDDDLRLCEAYRRGVCIGHTADIVGRTAGSVLHRWAMHRMIVQNVNARGTMYSIWTILRKCEGCCEARLVRRVEQIW